MKKEFNQKALEFFSELRNTPWINAGGKKRGCNLRAEVIASWLQTTFGEAAGKIWCWGAGWNPSEHNPQTPSIAFLPSYDCHLRDYGVNTNYHVAPFMQDSDGTLTVFDPVYFDGPVNDEEWLAAFTPLLGDALQAAYTDARTTSLKFINGAVRLTENRHFTRMAASELEQMHKSEQHAAGSYEISAKTGCP